MVGRRPLADPYIGEILTYISEESGIKFVLNSKDGALGVPDFIQCKEMSIVDFMDSILSLNSIRGGYWRWERIVNEKTTIYQLIRTLGAIQFPELMNTLIEADFKKDLDICMKAVDMGESERNEFLKNDPVASKYKFEKEIPLILKSFKSLPESSRNQIIESNGKISVQLSSLSKESQDYINDFFGKTSSSSPQSVSFSVSRTWNGIPRLTMQWGMFVRGSIGGTPFQNKWLNDLSERWIMEGDSKNDPSEDLDHSKEPSQTEKQKDLMDSIFQWSKINNINIIGHCSLDIYKYQALQGKITKEKIFQYLTASNSMYKWREKTLIISYPKWFIRDSKSNMVNYSLLDFCKKQTPLNIPGLIHIYKNLTEQQEKELSFRFPEIMSVIQNQRGELQFLVENRPLTLKLLGCDSFWLKELGAAVFWHNVCATKITPGDCHEPRLPRDCTTNQRQI